MYKNTILLIGYLLLLNGFFGYSQTEKINSTNHSTLYGIGKTSIRDTYLSPLFYTGTELRIVNERHKMSNYFDGNLSSFARWDCSFSETKNPALTSMELSLFFDLNRGYHYRFSVTKDLKLLAGGLLYASGGVIYNMRNSNNPISGKIGVGLAGSGMALYNLKIKNQPLTMRLQLISPFVGAAFSPGYGQSYYDIFSLGDYDNVVKFSSYGNSFACKTIVSADIPFNKFTVRLAYQNTAYTSDFNQLKTEMYSNTFLIGLVSEFVSVKGKKQTPLKEMINGAYY